MDLLGYFRQERGDQGHPDKESDLEALGRNAEALLLGRLHPSLENYVKIGK
jgi:hypothetical protein